jgi:hypothetical protein
MNYPTYSRGPFTISIVSKRQTKDNIFHNVFIQQTDKTRSWNVLLKNNNYSYVEENIEVDGEIISKRKVEYVPHSLQVEMMAIIKEYHS